MELAQGTSGNAKYDVALAAGGLKVDVSYNFGSGTADVGLVISADMLVAALEKAWPNSIAVAVEEALRKYIDAQV